MKSCLRKAAYVNANWQPETLSSLFRQLLLSTVSYQDESSGTTFFAASQAGTSIHSLTAYILARPMSSTNRGSAIRLYTSISGILVPDQDTCTNRSWKQGRSECWRGVGQDQAAYKISFTGKIGSTSSHALTSPYHRSRLSRLCDGCRCRGSEEVDR